LGKKKVISDLPSNEEIHNDIMVQKMMEKNPDEIVFEIPLDQASKDEIESKKEEIKSTILGVIRKVSKMSIKYKDYKEDWQFVKKKCAWIRQQNRCHTCILHRNGCLLYEKWKKRWDDE